MKRIILFLLTISCLMSLLSLVSCSSQPVSDQDTTHTTTESDSSTGSQDTETETVDLTPITVDADEAAYSSYVLPHQEDISEENQEELSGRVFSDGKIHYIREYSDSNKQLIIHQVFTFDSFIELEHGTYERPYLFADGLPLKIRIASTIEPWRFYVDAYVPIPAVYGAFRDLVLPLSFQETGKTKIDELSQDTFVCFEYDGNRYYILDTGNVYCGSAKSETTLSDEETALFLAYKFAFMYACSLGGSKYIDLNENNDFAVAIKENGLIRYLEKEEARDFVLSHTIKHEDHQWDGEYLYLQDVNMPDADYGPIRYEFAICESKDADLPEPIYWFKFHEGGLITYHGSPKFEMTYAKNPRTVQGLVVPNLTAVFIKTFDQ